MRYIRMQTCLRFLPDSYLRKTENAVYSTTPAKSVSNRPTYTYNSNTQASRIPPNKVVSIYNWAGPMAISHPGFRRGRDLAAHGRKKNSSSNENPRKANLPVLQSPRMPCYLDIRASGPGMYVRMYVRMWVEYIRAPRMEFKIDLPPPVPEY